jgi:hypothetical protein
MQRKERHLARLYETETNDVRNSPFSLWEICAKLLGVVPEFCS